MVYFGDKYFGYTRSKKVVSKIKALFSKSRSIHVNDDIPVSFDMQGNLGDDYLIEIYTLKDQFGNDRSVISTYNEQNDARIWINEIIFNAISFGKYALDCIDMFNALDGRLLSKLGNYHPIELEVVESEDGSIFDLTYEGYMLYISTTRREGVKYDIEKDLCML